MNMSTACVYRIAVGSWKVSMSDA